MSIRFDDVWSAVTTWAKSQSTSLVRPPNAGQGSGRAEVVFVRDLRGRIRVALDWNSTQMLPPGQQIPDWPALHTALGAFSPGVSNICCYKKELIAPSEVFDNADLRPFDIHNNPTWYILDRQIVGADWLHKCTVGLVGDKFNRITFFGLKGGVGRSTALAMLALRIAEVGKKVLVVDLDLESPGVGSILLERAQFPEFGVVDWFVEDAVGQADAILLTDIVGTGVSGIRVAPAAGRRSQNYLSKLSRTYLDSKTATGIETFTQRLLRFVKTLEDQEKSDFTIIDSRGGIHDLAAAAVTQLGALALMFAHDSRQTWDGYTLLFNHWTTNPDALKTFRENLKIVHALSPSRADQRVEADLSMRNNSHNLFVNTIYENLPAGQEGYSFGTDDTEAPHYPLPVRWSEAVQGLDPAANPTTAALAEVKVVFKDFLNGVSDLIGIDRI